MDIAAKDRLILALCAQLAAERETRAALAGVIANGQLSPTVLTAILTDPVPAVSAEDLARAERLTAARFPQRRPATREAA